MRRHVSHFLPAALLLAAVPAGLPAFRTASAQDGKAPEAEEKSPAAVTADTRNAIAAMRRQDWDAAAEAWEAVLLANPDNPAALSNLGKVEWQRRRLAEAAKHLERSVALKPDLTESWLTLGHVYLDLDSPMRAVSCLTRAVAESPADPRCRNALAIVLKRIGWNDGAESELLNAIDLKPDYAEAHFNLAVIYLERKPPALELAGRHYAMAKELGAEPDTLVEKQLKGESEIEETHDAGDGDDDSP